MAYAMSGKPCGKSGSEAALRVALATCNLVYGMGMNNKPKIMSSTLFHPPLSDEMLLEQNFFDLYPIDGGGALVTPEMVSSTSDDEFARQILEENALRDFGTLPRLDHKRFERWRTGQKSCWINRFYWIVPLAKRAAVTRNTELAGLVVDCLRHFIDTCPPPADKEEILTHMRRVYDRRDNSYNQATYEEVQQDETDIEYIWFDMEPACRLIHWVHAMHYLELACGLPKKDKEKIAASMYHHGKVIYYGEHGERELTVGDNHQSVRGIALLYAGAMFQGMPLADEFIADGIRIMDFHSASGFFADGALTEISPSYHAFQLWHLRDAYLLSKQVGFELDACLEKQLKKATAYLQAVTDPDGRTVCINDAYPFAARAFLKSLAFLDEFGETKSPAPVCGAGGFSDAGIFAYRANDIYLLLDASPFIGRASHHHCGKIALTLWIAGKPLFVDSGCPPYDAETYISWYRRGEAHSSLLVDDVGDGIIHAIWDIECLAQAKCEGWSTDENNNPQIGSTMTGITGAWEGITWTRTVAVKSESEVEVLDEVQSPREVGLTFIFNLHPDVLVALHDGYANYTNDKHVLKHDLESSVECEVSVEAGRCIVGFEERQNQQLRLKLHCRDNVTVRSTIARVGASPDISYVS